MVKSYKQEKLFSKYGIPENAQTGVCLAFCARYLMDTKEFTEKFGTERFDIDTMNQFSQYKDQWSKQKITADEFIQQKYNRKKKNNPALTALSQKRPDVDMTANGRYLLGLTSGKSGHSLAIIKKDAEHWLFDPNYGIVYCSTRAKFE